MQGFENQFGVSHGQRARAARRRDERLAADERHIQPRRLGQLFDQGAELRGQRFDRLPAGRAILLTDSDIPTYVQLVNPLVDESVAADGR